MKTNDADMQRGSGLFIGSEPLDDVRHRSALGRDDDATDKGDSDGKDKGDDDDSTDKGDSDATDKKGDKGDDYRDSDGKD